MMCKTLVAAALAAAAVASVSAQKYNASELAEIYINLGSLAHNPETVDCSRYASLFTPTAELHQPGVANCYGHDGIEKCCLTSHGLINPLISYQETNIEVKSWNMEVRTAFRWTINGRRVTDKVAVSAPAISFFLQNTAGLIEKAYSFYDPALVSGGTPLPPSNADKDLVDTYIRYGASGSSPTGLFCTAWADLFASNGTNNEPGIPPSTGTADITKRCASRAEAWHIYLPAAQEIVSVTSWDDLKRIAVRYTMTGETKDNKAVVADAISVLFFDKSGKIDTAWDFFDTKEVPTTL